MKVAKPLLLLLLLALCVFGSSRLIYRETLAPTAPPFFMSKRIPTANYQKVRVLVQRLKSPGVPIPSFQAQIIGSADGASFKIMDMPEGQLSSTAVVDMPPSEIGIGIEGEGTFEVLVWAQ